MLKPLSHNPPSPGCLSQKVAIEVHGVLFPSRSKKLKLTGISCAITLPKEEFCSLYGSYIFWFLLILKPFDSVSCRSSLFEDLLFILKAILSMLKGIPQKVSLHDLCQSVSYLCTTVYPSQGCSLSQEVFDCSGKQLCSKFLTRWRSCSSNKII